MHIAADFEHSSRLARYRRVKGCEQIKCCQTINAMTSETDCLPECAELQMSAKRGRPLIFASVEEREAVLRERRLRIRSRMLELKHTLREHGCLVSAKRGRPRIYDNDDARKAALKEQQRLCRLRHAQRLKDACAALARSSALEHIVAGDK